MERNTLLTWSWPNVLTKKRYDALRQVYGDLDSALENLNEEMLSNLGCKSETALKVLNRREEFDADAYETELKKRDLSLISIEDSSYPTALAKIDDPPIFLYYRGDLNILNQPCIALVGTREMSSYGARIAEHFIPQMVASGVVTVSGLAYGIDAEVAKVTIQSGGRTVAVLGHGFGMIYPKGHKALAEQIVEKGGLLLSEFPLDVAPDKYTFPARNRIIAGLSLGTVVLEAAKESGSLITADLALDYNKGVFAVPGPIFDPHYEGCNELIAKGTAKLVTCAEDVLQEFGINAGQEPSCHTAVPLESPEEQKIFDSLTTMPQALDDLVVRSALSTAKATAMLTMLEMKGVAKNVGGGMWVKR